MDRRVSLGVFRYSWHCMSNLQVLIIRWGERSDQLATPITFICFCLGGSIVRKSLKIIHDAARNSAIGTSREEPF
jgi:hypothetical protein